MTKKKRIPALESSLPLICFVDFVDFIKTHLFFCLLDLTVVFFYSQLPNMTHFVLVFLIFYDI